MTEMEEGTRDDECSAITYDAMNEYPSKALMEGHSVSLRKDNYGSGRLLQIDNTDIDYECDEDYEDNEHECKYLPLCALNSEGQYCRRTSCFNSAEGRMDGQSNLDCTDPMRKDSTFQSLSELKSHIELLAYLKLESSVCANLRNAVLIRNMLLDILKDEDALEPMHSRDHLEESQSMNQTGPGVLNNLPGSTRELVPVSSSSNDLLGRPTVEQDTLGKCGSSAASYQYASKGSGSAELCAGKQRDSMISSVGTSRAFGSSAVDSALRGGNPVSDSTVTNPSPENTFDEDYAHELYIIESTLNLLSL